MIATRVQELKD